MKLNQVASRIIQNFVLIRLLLILFFLIINCKKDDNTTNEPFKQDSELEKVKVEFNVARIDLPEGDSETVSVTVILSDELGKDVMLSLKYSDDGAITNRLLVKGTDYDGPNMVTIPSNNKEATITITSKENNNKEDKPPGFKITLGIPDDLENDLELGDIKKILVFIQDNDEIEADDPGTGTLSVGFESSTVNVAEIDSVMATLSLTFSGDVPPMSSSEEVILNIAATDGSATDPTDYTASGISSVIINKDTTNLNIGEFNIPIVNDTTMEGVESFTVDLEIDPASTFAAMLSMATVTVNIEANDGNSTISLGTPVAPPTISENEMTMVPVVLNKALTSDQTLVVRLASRNTSTATIGTDMSTLNDFIFGAAVRDTTDFTFATLTFDSASATSMMLPINITDDSDIESEEIIQLYLETLSGSNINGIINGNPSSTPLNIMIPGNDGVIIGFASNTATITEGNSYMPSFSLTGFNMTPAMIEVVISINAASTATSADYGTKTNPIIPMNTDTSSDYSGSALFNIIDDSMSDPGETIILNIDSLTVTGITAEVDSGNSSQTVTISDSAPPPSFTLTSSQSDGGFNPGGVIPNEFKNNLSTQCTGQNNFPKLTWSNPPAGTMSFVLFVEDQTASFVHLNLYNIASTATGINKLIAVPSGDTEPVTFPAGTELGGNGWFGSHIAADANALGWGGPCPPDMTGTHNYYFKLYALDTTIPFFDIIDNRSRSAFESGAYASRILGSVEIFGTSTF